VPLHAPCRTASPHGSRWPTGRSTGQDEQLSYEQAGQGNYTLQLMLAWNNGTFSGNYDDFHKAICAHMPSHQTPNHMVIGQPNTAFDMQRPFEI
jgi:metacaspase-1